MSRLRNAITRPFYWFTNCIRSICIAAKGAVDIRDFHIYGGLGMLFYGLYQVNPFIAYTVSGIILLVIGLGWAGRLVK